VLVEPLPYLLTPTPALLRFGGWGRLIWSEKALLSHLEEAWLLHSKAEEAWLLHSKASWSAKALLSQELEEAWLLHSKCSSQEP
jgi:hypothetical protein